MADTVANTTLQNTPKRLVVSSVFTIDGTEAADLVLVDRSTFTGLDGTEPGRLVIEKIEWALDGFKVLLEFEHTTDDEIAVLSGQGCLDFSQDGKYQGFIDPNSSGGTGDIVATTLATDAGDEGSIVLTLRKKD
jgi:hypothetical protein